MARINRLEERLKGLIESNSIDPPTFSVNQTNHRVGIGTTGPDNKLHVYAGESGFTGTADAHSVLVLEKDNSVRLEFLSPNNKVNTILFGDADSQYVARIEYDHATDAMRFDTASAQRMAITSTGNVGIGTTSPDSRLDVEDGAISFMEMGIPAAPAAEKAVLFVTRDDATGKTKLCVQWSDGSIVTLSTQI